MNHTTITKNMQQAILEIETLLNKKEWKSATEKAIALPIATPVLKDLQQALRTAYEQHLQYDKAGLMHHLDYLADQDECTTALFALLDAMRKEG
jgi:hypothetical protein